MSKSNKVDTDNILTDELQKELLGNKQLDAANQLIVTSKKKKAKPKADPLNQPKKLTAQDKKMSRAKRKRYERFLERQKKAEERKELYKSLAESNISKEEAQFYFSSSSRGQKDTLKSHIKRTLQYSQAGMDLTNVLGQKKVFSVFI